MNAYKSNEEYTKILLQIARDELRIYQEYLEESVFRHSVYRGNDRELQRAEIRATLKEKLPEEEKEKYAGKRYAIESRIRILTSGGIQAIQSGCLIPFEYLCRVFQADDFLRHCLILALAPELDCGLERVYSLLEDSWDCIRPTLQLCLSTYTQEEEEQEKLLRRVYRDRETYLALFSSKGKENFGSRMFELQIEERILQFLFQPEREDPVLDTFCSLSLPSEVRDMPMAVHGEKAEQLAELLKEKEPRERIYYIYGPEGAGKKFLVKHVYRELERPCLFVKGGALKEEQAEDLLRRAVLEALIRRSGLCIWDFHSLCRENQQQETEKLLTAVLQRLPYVLLLSEEKWPYGRENLPGAMLELELEAPGIGERVRLWEMALEREGIEGDFDLASLSAKYAFTPGKICAGAKEAERLARWRREPVGEELLYEACRRQISHKLGEKAALIKAAYQWEDLILPPFQKKLLRNACNQIEYYQVVYEQWDFQKKLAYGRGVSMLFYGPPGTGKTMGAQVIAGALHLELYKVDLSSVMSKYIGETEKNLDGIFEEVKKSQSILFFDEADALFGKRSEVKDAQDKYANAETAYLLQKMEEYEGIVILATNYLQNFDEAFKRRIKFMIEFPLPDRERRRQIWESVYPAAAEKEEDLDFDYLARQFELSGSSIKNIAVASAFLAASEQKPIGMEHILFALSEEMKKSGKLLQRDEFGEYAHMAGNIFQE